MDGKRGDGRWSRRHVLGTLAAGAVGSLATAGTASACDTSDRTFHLVQGHDHYVITPLSGEETAAEFYDWDESSTDYSSEGTTHLQRPDTSILFLYEGPDGDVYLICVHGELDGEGYGGSVTFDFVGLPHQGSWVVGDDRYQGSSNYDRWETDGLFQTVDWTWASGRTDGGVYGPIDGDPFAKIVPSFNDEAALHGEHYDGSITEWQVLSDDCDGPTRHTLDMGEPVSLLYNPVENDDFEDVLEEKRERWREIVEEETDKERRWWDDDDEEDDGNNGNGRKSHDEGDKPGNGPWWDDGNEDDGDDNGPWWADDERDSGKEKHDDKGKGAKRGPWWADDDDDTDHRGPWWADGD